MGVCKDPRLTYLNDHGYNVVRLPRKGIVPLGVIGRDRDSRSWLGTLDQIWESPVAVPVPGEPQPTVGLSGTRTSDLKLSFGLEILANALSGMFGATAPSLDVAYRNAKSLQFTFKDVQSVGIDPFVIGNFLAEGDLRGGPFVKRFFTGQKSVEALVVTEVLQARSIGVIAKKDANTEVAVDVPQIQATLGAKVSVAAANTSNTELVYEGPEFLTFGYKAFGIGMIDGEWNIYGIPADAAHAFALPPEPITEDMKGYVDANELVELEFPAD
jgi:hypothetical protein